MTAGVIGVALAFFVLYGGLSYFGLRWVALILAIFGMPALITLGVRVSVEEFQVSRETVAMILKYHLVFIAAAVIGWLLGWRFRR